MAQQEIRCDEEVMDSSPSSPLDAEIIKETLSNFSEETGFLSQTSLDSVPHPRNPNLVPNPNLESTNRKRGASHISDPSSSKPNKLPNIREAFIDAAHDNLLNNRYSVHNKGPYVISVQATNGGACKHALSMGKILHSTFPGLIKKIEKSDRARVTVECFDGKSANKIVTSKDVLSKFNLEAFIPNFRVSREGIIRNIPLDISTEDIIRFAATSLKCPIMEARRFVHKDEKGEKVPSTTVQIKFEGQEIPDFIDLFHMRIKVDPYITQPKLCYSCSRFGHVANQCKNPRCRFCGSPPHEKDQVCPQINGPYTCLNCKGSHLVSDKNCPVFKEQSTIRKMAAFRNIPIKEASQLFHQEKRQSGTNNTPFEPNYLYNKKSILYNSSAQPSPRFDYSNFPGLGEVDLDSPLGNPCLSNVPSYAGMASSNPKSPMKSPHKQNHNSRATIQKTRQRLGFTSGGLPLQPPNLELQNLSLNTVSQPNSGILHRNPHPLTNSNQNHTRPSFSRDTEPPSSSLHDNHKSLTPQLAQSFSQIMSLMMHLLNQLTPLLSMVGQYNPTI